MTTKTQDILYYPLWLLLHSLALLPFCVLYRLADLIYVILYYICHYRISIVRKNLLDSFPEMSTKQRLDIEKGFYHQLADYFVETIKLLHVSDRQIMQRMKFVNMDVANCAIARGQGVALYIGHLGNWEWITSITRWFKVEDNRNKLRECQIYLKLQNPWFNKFFLSLRNRFDSMSLEKHEAVRHFVQWRKEGAVVICGFIADQHPQGNDRKRAVRFLNHDTEFMTGTEDIVRLLNMVPVYCEITKLSRGHYQCTLHKLTTTPKKEPLNSITDCYIQRLEQNILSQPHIWLWSHNRWRRPCTSEPQPFVALNHTTEQ